MTSYDSLSRSTAAGVRTLRPPPDATTVTAYEPSTVPPSRVSAVRPTAALPPAGTVTRRASREKNPAGAGCPSPPVGDASSRSSVTSASPLLRYVTCRVTGASSEWGHACVPRLTETGSETTVWSIARPTARRPAPCWNTVGEPPSADPVRTALSCAPVQPGFFCLRIAAAPATCGVAIEVPSLVVYPGGFCPPVPAAAAAVTATPGAVRSGLTAPSPIRGPALENSAIRSSSSTAPTVSAASALPGEATVPRSGPLLPEATANRTPFSAETLFTCASIGSIPAESALPRLMLMTSAPWATAQSTPAMMPESSPTPWSSSTLALISCAPGATPLNRASFAPVPAAVEATCVPCPLRSLASGEPLKSRSATTLPARSGWEESIPVSTTAIFTPVPSYERSQAAGAPIWPVLRSSVALRTPSSQIRAMPDATAADPSSRGRVRASHSAPFFPVALSAPVTASASRTERVRRSVVPCEERTSVRAAPASAPR